MRREPCTSFCKLQIKCLDSFPSAQLAAHPQNSLSTFAPQPRRPKQYPHARLIDWVFAGRLLAVHIRNAAPQPIQIRWPWLVQPK